MCKGKMPNFSIELPLPLTIYTHFGHLHNVSNLIYKKNISKNKIIELFLSPLI